MAIHVDISVLGRVQKIGFRYYTAETAQTLDIKGYVRNLHDGSVFIEAEGKEEDIDIFVKWCYEGPPWARIDNVKVEKGELKNFKDFRIIK